MNNLGKFVKEQRDIHNMTQLDLSIKSDISRGVIVELETQPLRENTITLRNFTKILAAFDYVITVEKKEDYELRQWNKKHKRF